jgi:hypothetical protein
VFDEKYLVLATWISVGFFPAFAAAEGEEKPKPESQASADVKVETFSITVGSDSKVEVTRSKSKKESSSETRAEALGKVIVIGRDEKRSRVMPYKWHYEDSCGWNREIPGCSGIWILD